MIIIYFPKTLGGVSFEKAGKLFGGRKTLDKKITSYNFFIYKNFQRKFLFCFNQPSLADIIVKPKPPTFPGNDQRGFPFGNPKTYVFFLFLLLVVISFGYLAILYK